MSRKAKHCPICGATPCHWVPNVIETGAMDAYEEIVRCRDCKHYQVVDEIFDGEDDIAVYGCELLKWKRASFCYEEPTDPDGFCKWGGRRSE